MNKEEKQAIKDAEDILKELNKHKDKDFIGRLYYKNKPIEDILQILLKLIEKQQKEIEFYEIEELGYIQGYEDGKKNTQTAVAIRNENAQHELIRRHIENLEDELKDCIHKDKIRHIRDKAECMDYYSLNDVIDDLSKLLGDDDNNE